MLIAFTTIFVFEIPSCWKHVIFVTEFVILGNFLSYCGLVDARISPSGKDLPVQTLRHYLISLQQMLHTNRILIALTFFRVNSGLKVAMMFKSEFKIFEGINGKRLKKIKSRALCDRHQTCNGQWPNAALSLN